MIICDIDNCISDDAWRAIFVNHDAATIDDIWRAYHMAAFMDTAENLDVVRGKSVCFITAMPEEYRSERERWLRDWLPEDCDWSLLMRPTGDHTPSVELKRRLLQYVTSVGEEVIEMCYDDREDICAMYREEGLPATRLFIKEHQL